MRGLLGVSLLLLPALLVCLLVEASSLVPANASSSASPSFVNDASAAAAGCVPSLDIARGGGDVVAAAGSSGDIGVDGKTRDVILRFLDSHPAEDPSFHVHGWRWHFMALVRDSGRLGRLANRLSTKVGEDVSDSDLDALRRAADYVVTFNMAVLFRIESERSSKFLREHLCDGNSVGSSEADAFRKVADRLDEYRAQSERLGRTLYETANKAATASTEQRIQQLVGEVAKSSTELHNQLSAMRNLHETLVVPALSRTVPEKAQKSFNNKVLLSLGILESRLHLVGMHDAVREPGVDIKERTMFEREIPYVARAMIGRWRRGLYDPRAGALDHGSEEAE